MAQSYAEYLKSNGATDDEVKVLVTPASQKAYDAMQAQVTAAAAETLKAQTHYKALDDWHKNVAEPTAAKALAERDAALADAAAERARMKKLQDLGLLAIADQMEPEEAAKRAAAATSAATAPDLSKYVDRDTFLSTVSQEGDAIAIAQDIAFEHQRLFPDKPLNFRELRKQAIANKQSVEQQWMSTYGVAAARESRATADKDAYEKRLREEGASAERAKLSTVNPNLVNPQASSNPFTGKSPSAQAADAQPWHKNESERANARVQKQVGKLAVM